MDYQTPRQVGASDLFVSPLGFGGGTIGSPEVATADALATVQTAFETGVRFFDTAPWYGIGRSERRLGMALGDLNRRDEVRINTKVGKTLVPEPTRDESNRTYCADGSVRTPRDPRSGFRISFRYDYDSIKQQHEDSLQRLGLASVDSLTIHDIDYGYHQGSQLDHALEQLSPNGGAGASALVELRDAGRIKAIGCGCNLEARNAFSWEDQAHEDLIERILDLVRLDFFIVAGGYTLLETRALRRIFPLCEKRNVSIVAATPFAGGWLVDPTSTSTYMYGKPPQQVVDRSMQMLSSAKRHAVPLAAAALQFQLAHPLIAATIPGGKSPSECRQNRKFVDLPIPPAFWDELKAQELLDESAPTPY